MAERNGVTLSLAELIEMRHRVVEVQLFSAAGRRSPLIGLHHSRLRGRGVDFDQVRAYQPGDDVRAIDWRVTPAPANPIPSCSMKSASARSISCWSRVRAPSSAPASNSSRCWPGGWPR